MIQLGITYICVDDMEKSLNFYQALLQKKTLYCHDDRWIAFDCGHPIALYNKKYDEQLLQEEKASHFNQAYIDHLMKDDPRRKKNCHFKL